MASTHSNQNTVTFVFSFTFTLPIRLDRSNYTIWKSHIFYSVRTNGLEDLLDNSKCCPDQFLPNRSGSAEASGEGRENPDYVAWKR